MLIIDFKRVNDRAPDASPHFDGNRRGKQKNLVMMKAKLV